MRTLLSFQIDTISSNSTSLTLDIEFPFDFHNTKNNFDDSDDVAWCCLWIDIQWGKKQRWKTNVTQHELSSEPIFIFLIENRFYFYNSALQLQKQHTTSEIFAKMDFPRLLLRFFSLLFPIFFYIDGKIGWFSRYPENLNYTDGKLNNYCSCSKNRFGSSWKWSSREEVM